MSNNNSGQSTVELMTVLGLIIIPALVIGIRWTQTEWNKNECAFRNFKTARLQMIQTQKVANIEGISIIPLEDLDQNKGALEVDDLIHEVSQLWEQL